MSESKSNEILQQLGMIYQKIGWKKLLLWLLFIITGFWSKGAIFILGSIGFLIYAIIRVSDKETRKKGLIMLGVSGGSFFLGLIVLIVWGVSSALTDPPAASPKADTPVAAQETKKEVKPTVKLSFDSTTITTQDNKYIIKGSTEPGTKVTMFYNGKPSGVRVDEKGNFQFEVDTNVPREYSYEVVASKDGYQEARQTITVTREKTAAEIAAEKKAKEEAFKKSCITVKYGQLEKSPDKYIGKNVKFRGQVLEIQESNGIGFMRIAVTYRGYDIWDFNDVVWVNYFGSTDAVEEDIVTVYGTMMEQKTYTSQAGWTITIPQMNAEIIEEK
ncbi:hypothetical protein [Lihuaxuella thermophila]|uniref:Uncharacterized protein n=1 Tax=Lihuaxuella thermophila TaxID=1173111 RepID=A0A1H8D672_9BACL|nr:hypothetical protein [Lihuaxuella thermophila]SEN02801.1 hypothetical protein SAMN05444955_10510 [Lihuaxuella thermophila]